MRESQDVHARRNLPGDTDQWFPDATLKVLAVPDKFSPVCGKMTEKWGQWDNAAIFYKVNSFHLKKCLVSWNSALPSFLMFSTLLFEMIVMVSGNSLKRIYLSNQKLDHSMLGFWFVIVFLFVWSINFRSLRTSELEHKNFSQLLHFQVGEQRPWGDCKSSHSWEIGKPRPKTGLAILSAPQLCPLISRMLVLLPVLWNEEHERGRDWRKGNLYFSSTLVCQTQYECFMYVILFILLDNNSKRKVKIECTI